MVNIILCTLVVILTLTVLRLLWYVGLAVVLEVGTRRACRKYQVKSSYREAFMLECSPDMLKDNPYAKKLDRAIKRIDRVDSKSRKMVEKLSKMK